MTDVYLRHLDEVYGVKIGEIPFTEDGLNEAVRLAQLWGTYVDGQDVQDFHSAQLRLTDSRAYFEVIVGPED